MAIPRNLGNLASGADTSGVLQPEKGGTGATSTAAAPFALKGANSDITSLTGLTTALSVGQGGTGRNTLTANNVILGNGTSQVGLVAPGTSGNVLTSNGTTWTSAAPAGGGAWTFIQTFNAGGQSVIQIENLFTATYDTYVVVASSLSNNTGTRTLFGRLRIGSSYLSSGYYSSLDTTTGSGYQGNGTTNNSQFTYNNGGQYQGGDQIGFTMFIPRPQTSGVRKNIYWLGAAGLRNASGTASVDNTSGALTGLQFYWDAGTFADGVFRLYGIKNS